MMRSSILVCLLLFTVGAQAQDATYFVSDPTVSPDGSAVVFSYRGDLWTVPTGGGSALRLTAMDGNEILPRISPDGKWLAFTGSQSGNPDVYVVPMTGGEIRRLTFHSGGDQVDSWSWDSSTIYFNSGRYNSMTMYSVKVDGGTPVRIFEHFFNRPHNAVVMPGTDEYYFTDTWESFSQAHRKRYRGAYNPDIKSYNPATKAYTVHTDWEGKDMWTTIDRNGTVYFVSDRANGEYNLARLDGDTVTMLTSFDSSIERPQVSADGSTIVFVRDYQLYRYDVASGDANVVNVKLFQTDALSLDQSFDVRDKITGFDVSPDKKKLTFVSRGELFVSDIEGKFVRMIPTRSDGRVVEVKWLKDNETLLFNQTVDGYLNWFTVAANGSGTEKQLTADSWNNQALALSPDRATGVFQSGRKYLKAMNLETFEVETLVEDEFWGLYPTAPMFSPDGAYVAFEAYRDFETDIFIHHLESSSTVNLTHSAAAEGAPFWSADGKYLYFSADRKNNSYPRGQVDPSIYRIALHRFAPPMRTEEFDKLFVEPDTSKTTEKVVVTIDFDRIDDRFEEVVSLLGNQGSPYVVTEKNKHTVLFNSNHGEGKGAIWKRVFEPFEQTKTEKVADQPAQSIVSVDDKHFVLSNGAIHTLNLDGNKIEKIDIRHSFTRNLESEFRQMFEETWANVEENFYDENFHGTNWTAIRDKYAKFLPHLDTRASLRRLLNDMLGELNSSHMGFYSSGDEEDIFYSSSSLTAGLMFENERPFIVEHIVTDSPLDKMGSDVKPGDRLISINGLSVDATRNREEYFANPSISDEITLGFERDGKQFSVVMQPAPAGILGSLLYDEWIDANQKTVDESSDKRIAYIHMKNMGDGSLEEFEIEMANEAHHRDALILDLRYNTGGNVHDDVLQYLSRRKYLQWKYRGGKMSSQPTQAPADKPIVLLINEQSLSDAEMTSAGFKALNLGTIIGTETYRWIIFTSGKGLVDGSFYRLPSWGTYTLAGEDLEMTGVAPDIFVDTTFKDRLEGKDPQLDRAIQEILGQLE